MQLIDSLIILDNFKLKILFENEIKPKIFDLKPYLKNDTVFGKLNNETIFKKVENHKYFVQWPYEIDLSADTLYSESK